MKNAILHSKPSLFLYALVIISSFFRVDAYAQQDSTYIQNLSELLAVKVSVNNETNGFDLTINDINYEVFPNTSIHNSYTLSYRFLTFTVSFDPGAVNLNSDTDTRGETRTIQYATQLRFNRFLQVIEYNSTKGYYLRNTDAFDPNWRNGDPFIQFPDVSYTRIRGITLFRWNPNLSIAALSAPNTRQLQSVGTFIPNLSYEYYVLDDENGVELNTISQQARSFEATFSPGYMQTFVFKNTYLSLGAFPGAGFRNTDITREDSNGIRKTNRQTSVYRMALISGLGYDTGRFYCGTRFVGNLIYQNDPDGQASLHRNELNFELFVGYRFNAPGALRKTFNFVENALPFL